jgi:RNA polymerase sigma factor (sigma-70 family)
MPNDELDRPCDGLDQSHPDNFPAADVCDRWRDLFQTTESALRQICLVLADYHQDNAADLFSEIQVAVGHFLNRGGQIDNPLAYCAAIGRNIESKRRKRTSRFVRDAEPALEAAIGDATERLRCQLEMAHDLQRLLANITFDDRRFINMKYIDGMSSAMIGQKCGMSETAVNVRLHLIRCKVRKAFKNEYYRRQILGCNDSRKAHK